MFRLTQTLPAMHRIHCRTSTLNHFYLPTTSILPTNQRLNKHFHQTHQVQLLKNDLIRSVLDELHYKWKWFTYSRSNLQVSTVYLIEAAIDRIDYLEWFKYFEMEDTISSWFQITMLHVWMILVRISEPGKESEFFKQHFMKRMWEDLAVRINKLGFFPAREKNKFVNECSLVFNAAIVAYDEGLVGSDRELAASLWRTFFAYKCTDYTKLEILVNYVRTQLQYLANIKTDQLHHPDQIKWKKFDFAK